MTKELDLVNSDRKALVGEEDYEWAKNYSWMVNEDGQVVRTDAQDFYLCNGVAARQCWGSFTKHYRFGTPR
jgi:hypothetical protein